MNENELVIDESRCLMLRLVTEENAIQWEKTVSLIPVLKLSTIIIIEIYSLRHFLFADEDDEEEEGRRT